MLLVYIAELPGWLLWTPLAVWVALLVWCAVRLPRLVTPALGVLGVAALAVARAPWNAISFALALTVGAATLGAAARGRMRPGTAVFMASVPLVAWVAGFYMGPNHASVEATFRGEWLQAMARAFRYDARLGVTPAGFEELRKRVTDWMVLLLPTFSVVQAPVLMAWGYSLATAALERGERALRPLPRVSRFRLPDGAVWLLCLGLFLLLTRQNSLLRTGANLSAVMAVAYFCQGLSVLAFMAMALRAAWMVVAAMGALALLVLFTPFGVFTCLLGLSDVWLDLRRLGSGPGEIET